MNSGQIKHVCICICTYKRPQLLSRLLRTLREQETDGLFTFSIVVADNDAERSAEALVSEFAAESGIAVTYCVEPKQNISLTRNKAIANSIGDFIAFIDDDEFAERRWLVTLFQACGRHNADGVLGPVKCHFDEEPPRWVVKGRFYERRTYSTGLVIDWTKGRTGNVLLRKELFEDGQEAFSPEFHRAGDQDFFRRMIAKGYTFIWCNEAVAYEVVQPIRWTRTFMLKRALLRGTIGMQHPKTRLRRIAKAMIALPVYALALPFSLVMGHHRFMSLLVKFCDHLASLLTFIGIKPVRDQLITD